MSCSLRYYQHQALYLAPHSKAINPYWMDKWILPHWKTMNFQFAFLYATLAKNINFSLPGNRGGGYECITYLFKWSVLALSKWLQITIHFLINIVLFASKGQHASYIPMGMDGKKLFSRLHQGINSAMNLNFHRGWCLEDSHRLWLDVPQKEL